MQLRSVFSANEIPARAAHIFRELWLHREQLDRLCELIHATAVVKQSSLPMDYKLASRSEIRRNNCPALTQPDTRGPVKLSPAKAEQQVPQTQEPAKRPDVVYA